MKEVGKSCLLLEESIPSLSVLGVDYTEQLEDLIEEMLLLRHPSVVQDARGSVTEDWEGGGETSGERRQGLGGRGKEVRRKGARIRRENRRSFARFCGQSISKATIFPGFWHRKFISTESCSVSLFHHTITTPEFFYHHSQKVVYIQKRLLIRKRQTLKRDKGVR